MADDLVYDLPEANPEAWEWSDASGNFGGTSTLAEPAVVGGLNTHWQGRAKEELR